MSNISLVEQMGAMALIDELRFSQAELQKHLDLPKHRKLVAERIREFYRARGTEVDDALVEEGVRNFFAHRLTYQAPTIGFVQRLLGRAYIRRNRWLPPVVMVLVFCIYLPFGLSVVGNFFGDLNMSSTQIAVDKTRVLQQNHVTQRYQLEKRLATLEADSRVASVPAIRAQLDEARRVLERSAAWDQLTLPLKVTAQSKYEDYSFAEKLKGNLQKDSTELSKLSTQLDKLTTQTAAMRDHLGEIDSLRNTVLGMGLSASDLAPFETLFAKAEDSVLKLNNVAAEEAYREIEQLRKFAATPLKLEVVSRDGEKSLVERNFDATGGKAWYLITQALDPAGYVVPVPITSVENGGRRYAKVFGVRVNQATYQAVKNDKLKDGHVDDRLMGKKDANSLTFNFVKGPVKTQPDYILEW